MFIYADFVNLTFIIAYVIIKKRMWKNMKKRFCICAILILVILICVIASSCSSKFDDEDFSIELSDVKVDGNNVSVSVIFKNNSFKSDVVIGTGAIVYIFYEDENGKPDWCIPSIAVKHLIYAKQKIKKTEKFELPKGVYKVYGIADFDCDGKSYYYETEVFEVVVE